jgi:predicted transposase YbfD/YdcC
MALLGGHFDLIPDPRRDHGKRHALPDIFALVLCAVVSGADSFLAIEAFGTARIDWLRRFIPLENGVPSHDTLRRVFALVERRHFERAFAAWAQEAFRKTDGQVVAIDGKRLRRARNAGQTAITVVSAWASQSGVALGQVATHEGEGEISAIPRLLELLDVAGCIVTTDAAGCQTDIAALVVGGGGDYVFGLKGNQAGLRAEAERWMMEATMSGAVDAFETSERGHGREETRRYWSAPVPGDALRRYLWPGLASVGLVESTRIVGGKTSTEQRYFATSLVVDAEMLAGAVRGHWGVENGLHWTLDVAFREDESRTRVDHAAANLAVARRVGATLLKAETTAEGGVQTKRMRCAWDADYLAKVLQVEGDA